MWTADHRLAMKEGRGVLETLARHTKQPVRRSAMAKSRLCSIPDCGKKHMAKGFCNKHYMRNLHHGSPHTIKKTKVDGSGKAYKWLIDHMGHDGEGCLIWPFYINRDGYGHIKVAKKMQIASRLMCHLVNGPPPSDEHEASHLCHRGKSGCVHPRHLIWETKAENIARSRRR